MRVEYAHMQRKNVLILCRDEERKNFDNADKLSGFLHDANTQTNYKPATFEELAFVYDGQNLTVFLADGTDIASFDLIFMFGWFKTKLLEDIAHSVAVYAHFKNVPFLNTETLHERSKSKLSQYVTAVVAGVPVVPFIVSSTSSSLEQFANESVFSGELIVKAIMGSRGDDNYKVSSFQDALKIIRQRPETPFVIQEFVPNDGDLRVIVVGDEVGLIISRKSAPGSHLNNTSKGGQANLLNQADVADDILKDSIKMAKALRREVSGIDMIIHSKTGQHYLLEANNMPQIATGAFVSEKAQVLAAYFDKLSKSL